MTQSIEAPYPFFHDKAGEPIHNGYIYIGEANSDAQSNPVIAYWDAELTITAAQPIRTIYGYPSRDGTTSRIYTASDYSIKVLDKNGSLVYSANTPITSSTTDSSTKFDSVADMVASSSLTSGQLVETKSYYDSIPFSNNQGGAAKYRIMTLAEYGASPDNIGAAFTLANGNVAVHVHNGEVCGLQYGIVMDDSTDNGTRLLALIAASKAQSFMIKFTDGIAISNSELVIDQARMSIHGTGKNMCFIKKGPSFPSGGTLLTIRDCGRTSGTGTGEQPYHTGTEKAVELIGFSLLGDRRRTIANGIYFEGLNDDAEVDIEVRDFRGKGLAIGNAAGTSSATDTVRECTFGSIHVKNCGNIVAGANDAAVEIGSQGSIADGTNNIWFEHLRIVYPRGNGLKVRGNSSHRTRKIRIGHMFLHGNQQLPAGNDANGESWKSGRDLVFIGISGATGSDVASVCIDRLDMIGLETGRSAFVTYTGSSLHVSSFTGSAPATSSYFVYTGAATSSLHNYLRESPSVGSTANSTANLITMNSMDTAQSQLLVSNLGGATVPAGTPSLSGAFDLVSDGNIIHLSHNKDATDAIATQTFPVTTFIGGYGVRYFQQFYIFPSSSLTANDADYATIQFLRINSSGGVGIVLAEITTQTAGAGGSGNWTLGNPIVIPTSSWVTNRLNKNEGICVRITKTGAGVIVPPCSFHVDLSPNLSLI